MIAEEIDSREEEGRVAVSKAKAVLVARTEMILQLDVDLNPNEKQTEMESTHHPDQTSRALCICT